MHHVHYVWKKASDTDEDAARKAISMQKSRGGGGLKGTDADEHPMQGGGWAPSREFVCFVFCVLLRQRSETIPAFWISRFFHAIEGAHKALAAIEAERREVDVERLERDLARRRALLKRVEELRDRQAAAAIRGAETGTSCIRENPILVEVSKRLPGLFHDELRTERQTRPGPLVLCCCRLRKNASFGKKFTSCRTR